MQNKITMHKSIRLKLLSNFIKIALRHGCSPVNLPHIFRTPFLKNTSRWLLLFVETNKEYFDYPICVRQKLFYIYYNVYNVCINLSAFVKKVCVLLCFCFHLLIIYCLEFIHPSEHLPVQSQQKKHWKKM